MAATAFCPKTASVLLLSGTEMKTCTKHTEPAKITVPKLIGMTKDDALAALSKLKLKSKVAEKAVSGVVPGTVAEQTPSAGSTATSQTVVTITVSHRSRRAGSSHRSPSSPHPALGKVGVAVTFDASNSTDDGTIAKWLWEFGDGSTSTAEKTTHAFATAGSYDVKLTVTDDNGQSDSVTRRIRIQ